MREASPIECRTDRLARCETSADLHLTQKFLPLKNIMQGASLKEVSALASSLFKEPIVFILGGYSVPWTNREADANVIAEISDLLDDQDADWCWSFLHGFDSTSGNTSRVAVNRDHRNYASHKAVVHCIVLQDVTVATMLRLILPHDHRIGKTWDHVLAPVSVLDPHRAERGRAQNIATMRGKVMILDGVNELVQDHLDHGTAEMTELGGSFAAPLGIVMFSGSMEEIENFAPKVGQKGYYIIADRYLGQTTGKNVFSIQSTSEAAGFRTTCRKIMKEMTRPMSFEILRSYTHMEKDVLESALASMMTDGIVSVTIEETNLPVYSLTGKPLGPSLKRTYKPQNVTPKMSLRGKVLTAMTKVSRRTGTIEKITALVNTKATQIISQDEVKHSLDWLFSDRQILKDNTGLTTKYYLSR